MRKRKLQCQFNQIPTGTTFFKNGDVWVKQSSRTAHLRDDEFYWYWFSQKELVTITPPKLNWTAVNRDSNGNSRSVVHFLECCPESWKEDKENRYANVCKLMNQIGGRKFHNRQYGGGILFQTSVDGAEYIEEFIAKKVMGVDAENGFTY